MMVRHGNPFKPTAGMNPPELIGRDTILDDFRDSLENGPGAPDRLMRISGVRGVGKTVLLNALGDIAREYGFRVVDMASNKGFCERILNALTRDLSVRTVSAAPSAMELSVGSVSMTRAPITLGEAMLGAANQRGLLVTLDEIQDAPLDELRELGNEIQLLIRQGANVAFAFAGLPAAVDEAVGADTLTFLQRARQVELSRLSDFAVGESFEDTIRRTGKQLDEGVADILTEAAAGYPFMVQLVGYYTWQAANRRESTHVSSEDARVGVDRARDSFGTMVIAPALRRLPQRQIEYLLAMACCSGSPISTGEVSERMGCSTKDTSSYRKRLIDAAIIEKVGYGSVDFAIPYMREYLLSHAEDFE